MNFGICKRLLAIVSGICILASFVMIPAFSTEQRVLAAPTDKLKYSPPPLENPEILYINNENCTQPISKLTKAGVPAEGRDFIIVVEEKITRNTGIDISCSKARNIVMIGGEVEIPWAGDYDDPYRKGRRGFRMQDWTGVLHIEGLWLHGEDLAEGMNIDQRAQGGILQIQNYRCDNLKGRPEEQAIKYKDVNHPDIIQNWAGPTYYFVDHLTGETDYQGFMVQPTMYPSEASGQPKNPTKLLKFSNVNVKRLGGTGYTFYLTRTGTEKLDLSENVYFDDTYGTGSMCYWSDGPVRWPDGPWADVIGGLAPEDFCVASAEGGVGIAGMKYISPGYTGEGYPEEVEIVNNDIVKNTAPLTELPENFPTAANPKGTYAGAINNPEGEPVTSETDNGENADASTGTVVTSDMIPDNTTGGIAVMINGEIQSFDPAPILINDRTLIPMRAIFEKLGAQVSWDSGTGEITAQKGDMTLSMYIGNSTAKVNGEDVLLDVPAQLVDDRTMVPLRFIGETLQCKVDWIGEKQTVVITY